jgi:hypothetical protein
VPFLVGKYLLEKKWNIRILRSASRFTAEPHSDGQRTTDLPTSDERLT